MELSMSIPYGEEEEEEDFDYSDLGPSDPESPFSSGNEDAEKTPQRRQQQQQQHLLSLSQLSPAEAGLLSGIDSEQEQEQSGDDETGSRRGSGGVTASWNATAGSAAKPTGYVRSRLSNVERSADGGGGDYDGYTNQEEAAAGWEGGGGDDGGGTQIAAAAGSYYTDDSDFSADEYGGGSPGNNERSELDETMDETMRDEDEIAPGDLGIERIDDPTLLHPLNAGVYAAATAAENEWLSDGHGDNNNGGSPSASASASASPLPHLPGPELSPTHTDAATAEGFDDSAYVAVTRLKYYSETDGAGPGHGGISVGVGGGAEPEPKVKRLSVEGSPEPKDYSRRNSAESSTPGNVGGTNAPSSPRDAVDAANTAHVGAAAVGVGGGLSELFASASTVVSPSTLRQVLAIQHQALAALLGLGAAVGTFPLPTAPAAAAMAADAPVQLASSQEEPQAGTVGGSPVLTKEAGAAAPVAQVSPRLRTRPAVLAVHQNGASSTATGASSATVSISTSAEDTPATSAHHTPPRTTPPLLAGSSPAPAPAPAAVPTAAPTTGTVPLTQTFNNNVSTVLSGVQLLRLDYEKIHAASYATGGGRRIDGDAAPQRHRGPVPSPLPPKQTQAESKDVVLPLLRFGISSLPPPPEGSGTAFASPSSLRHSDPASQANPSVATISAKYRKPKSAEQDQQPYRFLPLHSLMPPSKAAPAYPLLRLTDPKVGSIRSGSIAGADNPIFPGAARMHSKRQNLQRTVDTNLILTSDDDADELDNLVRSQHDDDGTQASPYRSPYRSRGTGGAKKKGVDRATSPIATMVPFNAVERLEAERELELMHALDDLDAQVESALLRRRRPVTPSNRYDASEGASIVNRAAEHRTVINKVLAEAQLYREVGGSSNRISSAAPEPHGLHSQEADQILAAADAIPASLFRTKTASETAARAAAGPGPEVTRLREEWARVEALRHAQAPKDVQEQIDAVVASSKQPGHHDWRTAVARPEVFPEPLPRTEFDAASPLSSAHHHRAHQHHSPVPQQHQHQPHAMVISPRQSRAHVSFSDVPRQISGSSGGHAAGRTSRRIPRSSSVSSVGSAGSRVSKMSGFLDIQDMSLDGRDSIFFTDSEEEEEDSGRGGGRSSADPRAHLEGMLHGVSSALHTIEASPPNSDGNGAQHAAYHHAHGHRHHEHSKYTHRHHPPRHAQSPLHHSIIRRESTEEFPASPGTKPSEGTLHDDALLEDDSVLESIRLQLGRASEQLQSAEDADAALEAEMRDLSGLTSIDGGSAVNAADATLAFEGLSYLGNVTALNT